MSDLQTTITALRNLTTPPTCWLTVRLTCEEAQLLLGEIERLNAQLLQAEQTIKFGDRLTNMDHARYEDMMAMALAALEYHREQTRPIQRTDDTINALRARLGLPAGAKGGAA